MSWRAGLFGAGRARELAQQLAEQAIADIGISAASGLVAVENLVRNRLVLPMAELPTGAFGPAGRTVTAPRVPDVVAQLPAEAVLAGLGADLSVVGRSSAAGLTGLGAVPVPTAAASTAPLEQDEVGRAVVGLRLAQRVDQLVADTVPTLRRLGAPADGLQTLLDRVAVPDQSGEGER